MFGGIAPPLNASVRRQMRHFAFSVFVLAALPGCHTVPPSTSDPLCKPLQAFVASVGPGVTREVVFYTSWGSGFKGDSEPALYAKRCDHGGYAPAKAVCDFLMEAGAVEFSGNNVVRALSCLSLDTHFAPRMQLNQGEFEFSFGSEQRREFVKVSFAEEPSLGAMALRITANGY